MDIYNFAGPFTLSGRPARNALHNAAREGREDEVRNLLAHPQAGDHMINAPDGRGHTALTLALRGNHHGVAALLRDNGAVEATRSR